MEPLNTPCDTLWPIMDLWAFKGLVTSLTEGFMVLCILQHDYPTTDIKPYPRQAKIQSFRATSRMRLKPCGNCILRSLIGWTGRDRLTSLHTRRWRPKGPKKSSWMTDYMDSYMEDLIFWGEDDLNWCTRLGVEWFLCGPQMTNYKSVGPKRMQWYVGCNDWPDRSCLERFGGHWVHRLVCILMQSRIFRCSN